MPKFFGQWRQPSVCIMSCTHSHLPKKHQSEDSLIQGCLLAPDKTNSRDVPPLCAMPALQDLHLGGSWFPEGCFVVTETKTNVIREANRDGRELL